MNVCETQWKIFLRSTLRRLIILSHARPHCDRGLGSWVEKLRFAFRQTPFNFFFHPPSPILSHFFRFALFLSGVRMIKDNAKREAFEEEGVTWVSDVDRLLPFLTKLSSSWSSVKYLDRRQVNRRRELSFKVRRPMTYANSRNFFALKHKTEETINRIA